MTEEVSVFHSYESLHEPLWYLIYADVIPLLNAYVPVIPVPVIINNGRLRRSPAFKETHVRKGRIKSQEIGERTRKEDTERYDQTYQYLF